MKKEEIISLLEKLQNLSCFEYNLIDENKECILREDTVGVYYEHLQLYDEKKRTKYVLIIDFYCSIFKIYWMIYKHTKEQAIFLPCSFDEILDDKEISEYLKEILIFNFDIFYWTTNEN